MRGENSAQGRENERESSSVDRERTSPEWRE